MDNCFRFWYRYVFTNKTAIEQGAGAAVLKSFLPELNSYIGGPFEDICMQYMVRMNNLSALPFVFTQSGRWWGTNPKTRQQEKIDMVFSDTKHFIFAEYKWRNDLKDTATLETLIEKSKLLVHDNHKNIKQQDTFFYLFSKIPFSKSCVSLARQTGNVVLIDQKELFNLK
jgi:uncharacterized protein